MRNKHIFEQNITCKCPYQSCGKEFTKKITVEYITNQRGDIIEQKFV